MYIWRYVDMYINTYFTDEELEFIKLHDEGFVRQCVRNSLEAEIEGLRAFDDYDGVLLKSPRKADYLEGAPVKKIQDKAPEKIENNLDKIEELKKIPGIIDLKELAVKRGNDNPNICKVCRQPKMAGRCINNECKLKGKLQ